MSTVVVVALLGWAMGRHPGEVGALVAVHLAPIPVGCAVIVFALRSRSGLTSTRSGAALTLVRLSAELAAGVTPREAMISIGEDVAGLEGMVRLARAGRPLGELAAAIEEGLDSYGRVTAAALRMAAVSGGQLAPVIDRLAAEVLSLDDLRRERRAAVAPAMLQAAILAIGPFGVVAWMLVSGRLLQMFAAGPVHATLVLAGMVLVIAGVAAVVWIARRGAER
jgi:Flp pilus assembly protein TadB